MLIFVAIAAVIIGLAIAGIIQAKKRREALAAWAGAHGLVFSAANEYGLDTQFPDFDCLCQGSSRYAYNLMRGSLHGRETLAFDYHYETYSTDSKGRRETNHHHLSAVIVQSSVPLKSLFIRPEGFMDRVGEFFGFEPIQFESAEFNRRFHVKAPDRKWAYDVIHARTMEFLMASPSISLKFGSCHAIAYTGSTFDAAGFQQAFDVAAGVLDRLPDYVLQQQGGEGVGKG